jgi:subtilisin family serine protease
MRFKHEFVIVFSLFLIGSISILSQTTQVQATSNFSSTVEGIQDLEGNPITEAQQDETFQIKFSIKNEGDVDTPVKVVFMVENPNGVAKEFTDPDIISLDGNINTNYSIAATVTLGNIGTNTVTFEVWETLDDQINLLPSPHSCVTEAETVNGFEDTDGCPDEVPVIDTDSDGIPDSEDICVTEAETVNGFEDTDGCPDEVPVIDTDSDGISDSSDQCPNEAEIINGYLDTDGCPDSPPNPEEEKYNESYAGLAQTIYPKVEEPILEDFDDVSKPDPAPEKQETRLAKLQDAQNPSQFAKDSGLDYENGKTRLLIVADIQQTTLTKIQSLALIEAQSHNQFQIVIDVDKIPQLLEIEEINNIRPINRMIQNSVVSEGVAFVNADDVQLEGLTGKGVKVAVLDIAFDSANSKISNKVKDTKSFRFDFDRTVPLKGVGSEYRHGTAVAEIISDVAPDSELYLYTFSSELEFDEAAKHAAQKVDLIAMSAGWTNYPTDGTSSMTQTVQEIVQEGTPFVVSAGNYAETHWEGSLTDSDSNGWHEFEPGDEGLSFNIDQSRVSKDPILVYLMWEEPSSGVIDLDLSLVYEDTDEVVSTSANVQLGGGDAFEYIYFTPQNAGIYSLGVSFDGAKPRTTIEIFSASDRLEYATAQGSVSVPTDAVGVISVGAVNHNDAELEPFSSQGPTNNDIVVPSLVGPDAVTTTSYAGTFYGTSAAAPHVAGIAALLLEKQPSATPQAILEMLQENADKKAVGLRTDYTNVYGHGKADAEFIIQSVTLEDKISIPDWVKNNAGWWAQELISDEDFASGIQYMIKEGVIQVPTESSGAEATEGVEIPDWVRNNADWWSQDLISDKDFASGIQYLVTIGIISV